MLPLVWWLFPRKENQLDTPITDRWGSETPQVTTSFVNDSLYRRLCCYAKFIDFISVYISEKSEDARVKLICSLNDFMGFTDNSIVYNEQYEMIFVWLEKLISGDISEWTRILYHCANMTNEILKISPFPSDSIVLRIKAESACDHIVTDFNRYDCLIPIITETGYDFSSLNTWENIVIVIPKESLNAFQVFGFPI